MTHDELVKLAAKWATKKYPIVVTEVTSFSPETPDVLAFRSDFSCLIECKTSRADFRADAKKHFRRFPDMGMGNYRYYFAPKGIINKEDLPENWGLLTVNEEEKIRTVVKPQRQQRNYDSELRCLFSVVRRLGVDEAPGLSINKYTHQTTCKASISVEEEDD